MNADKVVNLLVVMLLVGLLVPIGLLYIVNSDIISITIDNKSYTLAEANPTISTLLCSIVPIMIVISVMLYFVPKARAKV